MCGVWFVCIQEVHISMRWIKNGGVGIFHNTATKNYFSLVAGCLPSLPAAI